jgi:hypothetical protein
MLAILALVVVLAIALVVASCLAMATSSDQEEYEQIVFAQLARAAAERKSRAHRHSIDPVRVARRDAKVASLGRPYPNGRPEHERELGLQAVSRR